MATIEQRKSINTFVAKQHFALNVALRHMPNHAPSQRDSTVKEKKKKKKKKNSKTSGCGRQPQRARQNAPCVADKRP
jgi:hypothetical protein